MGQALGVGVQPEARLHRGEVDRRQRGEAQLGAETVAVAGVTPWMAPATVERQRWAAQFGEVLPQGSTPELVDAVRLAAGLLEEGES